MNVSDRIRRDHLFISYAYEDVALAEWLALKLTSEGYKVWIDRFELLGGESYPEDIDGAIKRRTFRLLSLLSHDSLHKPNPLKERTLALNLQRKRGEELLIPLNVDGLEPAELDWMTSDLTFIPFSASWADGLEQLLKKLEKVGAPKGDRDGRKIAASAYLPTMLVLDSPESLYANVLRIEQIPAAISCYSVAPELTKTVRNVLADEWAFWALPPNPSGDRRATLYFSFWPPPEDSVVGDVRWKRHVRSAWHHEAKINGVWTNSIIKPLLRRTLLHHLRTRGLVPTPRDETLLYFPPGLLPGENVSFRMPDGRSTYRQVTGSRSYRGRDRFRYHQAVTIDIETDLGPGYLARFRIRLHLTDEQGHALKSMEANTRRKSMTWSWYNDEWLARHLALAAFFSAGADNVEIGPGDPLLVSGSLLELVAPTSINEAAIPKGTPRFIRTADEDEEGLSPPELEADDELE